MLRVLTIAWLYWWWDSTGLARAQVLTGTVGSLLALMAIIYAWRVARRQFRMMDEQGRIVDRQLQFAERQTEIAVRQHDLTYGYLAKLPKLNMSWSDMSKSDADERDMYVLITFAVTNTGTKAADGFYWELLHTRHWAFLGSFVDEHAISVKSELTCIDQSGDNYEKVDGFYQQKLFPESSITVARLRMAPPPKMGSPFSVKWRIHSETGFSPDSGYGEIMFAPDSDFFKETSQG